MKVRCTSISIRRGVPDAQGCIVERDVDTAVILRDMFSDHTDGKYGFSIAQTHVLISVERVDAGTDHHASLSCTLRVNALGIEGTPNNVTVNLLDGKRTAQVETWVSLQLGKIEETALDSLELLIEIRDDSGVLMSRSVPTVRENQQVPVR